MRRMVLMLMLVSWRALAQDTLFISTSQVVHLRFGSELKYVNLGSRDIVAKIVDGSKDFVAVKAREPLDGCTSLSCLESTGAMHTFLVAYREPPSRLEVDTRGGSPSAPEGEPAFSFSSQNLEKYVDMRQELYHIGAKEYGLGTVTPSSEGRMAFTFDKMALLRGQVLRVYIYEDGGARNLVMTLSQKDINQLRML